MDYREAGKPIPGPYWVGSGGDSVNAKNPDTGHTTTVAECPGYQGPREAHAKLFAAAPDLLTACRGMVSMLGALEEERGLKMLGVSVDAMNAAIAKVDAAEGSSLNDGP